MSGIKGINAGSANWNYKHGQTNTHLFRVWSHMKERCEREKHPYFKDYGGRGISVCPDWHSFKRFKEWANDNGYSDGLSLDRIDNNMGYSPNNCRWATPKQQANNRRDNVKIEYQGEKRTIAEWADRFGFNYPRFYQALKRGYTIDRYIEKEAHNRGNLHT